MIRKSLIAVVALGAFALRVSAQEQTILFDLGSGSLRTEGLVNNVTSPGEVGVLIANAQDTEGYLTSVAFRQSDGWSGTNTRGHSEEGLYPARAMQDSFYLGDGDDRRATIHIDGLTPGERYTFSLFGSRMEATGNRTARYRIGDEVAEMDASDNTATRVSIADVVPGPDGSVTIDIECAAEDGWAYLGVLEIEGAFAEGTLAREPADALDGPPPVSAKAWAIADGKTGEVLWGFNEDEPRKIASTTKMMCAWVVIQLAAADPTVLDEVVTFSELADQTGGSTSGVREGERAPLAEVLYGLLLPSGNDAGNALAEHFNDRFDPPEDAQPDADPNLATRANFVAEMNRNAQRLGMESTTYRIPYGDGGTMSQFTSTPRDLLKLACRVMQSPLFRKYVSTRRYRCVLTTPEGGERIVVWRNTNQLLPIEGYEGIKTGTTPQAGACLVSSGRRGEDHLLAVVLGAAASPCRYFDTRNLFRWAWLARGHQPE